MRKKKPEVNTLRKNLIFVSWRLCITTIDAGPTNGVKNSIQLYTMT